MMSDTFLILAGSLGMIISVVHGYIGETKVVAAATSPSPVVRRVLSAIMFLSALYWFAAGGLLVLTPIVLPPIYRDVTVIGVAIIFATGAAANCWATRGRHFGWVLLAIATVLTLLGR